MATAFDLTTYPLDTTTTFTDDYSVMRDLLDDGEMRLRVIGTNTFRTINCVFQPMSEAVSTAFKAYLITNRSTEFTMSFTFGSPIEVYTGYIFSDPAVTVTDGVLHYWSFQFRGKAS